MLLIPLPKYITIKHFVILNLNNQSLDQLEM